MQDLRVCVHVCPRVCSRVYESLTMQDCLFPYLTVSNEMYAQAHIHSRVWSQVRECVLSSIHAHTPVWKAYTFLLMLRWEGSISRNTLERVISPKASVQGVRGRAHAISRSAEGSTGYQRVRRTSIQNRLGASFDGDLTHLRASRAALTHSPPSHPVSRVTFVSDSGGIAVHRGDTIFLHLTASPSKCVHYVGSGGELLDPTVAAGGAGGAVVIVCEDDPRGIKLDFIGQVCTCSPQIGPYFAAPWGRGIMVSVVTRSMGIGHA